MLNDDDGEKMKQITASVFFDSVSLPYDGSRVIKRKSQNICGQRISYPLVHVHLYTSCAHNLTHYIFSVVFFSCICSGISGGMESLEWHSQLCDTHFLVARNGDFSFNCHKFTRRNELADCVDEKHIKCTGNKFSTVFFCHLLVTLRRPYIFANVTIRRKCRHSALISHFGGWRF